MTPPSSPWQLERPVSEDGMTYKIPSKQDIPVTTSTTLTPYRSRDTSARWGCGSGTVDNPVSIWGQLGRHALTKIPAWWLKMSPSEGRSSGDRERGGGLTSPPLCLHPTLCRPLLRIQARREFPPPPPQCPYRLPSGTPFPSPLPPCRSYSL
jgi:hypothetical protein